MSHSPGLESGLSYDSLVTKRIWQSGSVWHLRPASTWFSWEACSGGHSPTWDHRVERPHIGALATHRHSAEPSLPIIPTEVPNMWVRSHLGSGRSSPSPCLSHPAIPIFPVEAQTKEQRLATPDVSCPNCWAKEPMIIIKWFIAPYQ